MAKRYHPSDIIMLSSIIYSVFHNETLYHISFEKKDVPFTYNSPPGSRNFLWEYAIKSDGEVLLKSFSYEWQPTIELVYNLLHNFFDNNG